MWTIKLFFFEGIPVTHFEKYPGELELPLANGFFIRKENNIAVAPEKIPPLNEILTYFVPAS